MKKILLMIGMAILASNPVYAKETYMCFDPTTTQKFIAFTLYRASEVIAIPSDRSILHLPFVYDKKVDSNNPFLGTTKGFYKNGNYGINVFYNSIPDDPNVISAVWINFKHNVAISLLCKRQ